VPPTRAQIQGHFYNSSLFLLKPSNQPILIRRMPWDTI
jgi:hypothetical protein